MNAEFTSLATAGSSGAGSTVVPASRSSCRPVGFDSRGRFVASMMTTSPATGVAVAVVDSGESQPRTAIATRGMIMGNERGISAGFLLMQAMIVPAPR
jgi:hypothetical protein